MNKLKKDNVLYFPKSLDQFYTVRLLGHTVLPYLSVLYNDLLLKMANTPWTYRMVIYRFASQLEQLANMGFVDRQANIQASILNQWIYMSSQKRNDLFNTSA